METFDVSSLSARYYVYILYFYSDKGFYIGFSTNLKDRLIDHASGKVFSTKDRIPFKLIHYEYFINKKDAKAREEFLKSGYGRDQLKNFLKNTLLMIKGSRNTKAK
ncbi:GIY-YIG nuclease family protein [Candidatus Parcubacteria bacterium]|nr:MAG: GIY-YIG nuclease family protein [Candidatus Parcubacteria bacterium]